MIKLKLKATLNYFWINTLLSLFIQSLHEHLQFPFLQFL